MRGKRSTKIIVPKGKVFTFEKMCPYCGGDLLYSCYQWLEIHKSVFWEADILESECSNMPDPDDKSWNEFIHTHSVMPYIYQLPIDTLNKNFINSNYKFI